MKRIIYLLLVMSFAQICFASGFNTFETRQEAYDRRSYENYNTYRNNNYQQPLGGYNRSINDNGGRQYGSTYGNSGFGSMNTNHSRNYSTQNNSWNSF